MRSHNAETSPTYHACGALTTGVARWQASRSCWRVPVSDNWDRHSSAMRWLRAERCDKRGRWSRVHQVLRSEEHTSELQSLMRISYAVFCLKKKNSTNKVPQYRQYTHTTTMPHNERH